MHVDLLSVPALPGMTIGKVAPSSHQTLSYCAIFTTRSLEQRGELFREKEKVQIASKKKIKAVKECVQLPPSAMVFALPAVHESFQRSLNLQIDISSLDFLSKLGASGSCAFYWCPTVPQTCKLLKLKDSENEYSSAAIGPRSCREPARWCPHPGVLACASNVSAV